MVTSLASFAENMQKTSIALPTIISTHQKYTNLSQRVLCEIGRKYLAQYEVLNQEIYLQVIVRKFEYIDGSVTDSYHRSTFKQSIRNGTITTQKHEGVIPSNAQTFLTTNVPQEPPSAAFRAKEIFSRIKKTILQTAPLMEKACDFEWRLDVANYSVDELNEVAYKLRERGFSVMMTPPQIKMEDVRRKVQVSSTQYFCVTILPSAASKVSDKNFSPHQIYQTSKRIGVKSFAPIAQSKEYVIRGFNAELKVIANESPLVTTYPLDTACLNESERKELQEQLQHAGYNVTQNKPYFLVQEMDGLVFYKHDLVPEMNGLIFHKHDLLVELTNNPVQC